MEEQLAEMIESKISQIWDDKYTTKKQKRKYIKKLRLKRDKIETYGVFSLVYEDIKKIEHDFLNLPTRKIRKRISRFSLTVPDFL